MSGCLCLLAQATACVASDPYQVRVYVVDESECGPYEQALLAAIDWWADVGVDAFVYDGCAESEFSTSVVFFQPLEGNGTTDDLEAASDHVPVYAVDEIQLDQEVPDGEPVPQEIGGASQHGVTPYCPSLVALTEPRPELAAHELGHQVLLFHEEDEQNVMFHGQLFNDVSRMSVEERQTTDANNNFAECRKRQRDP